jgi:hypothetical protein
MKNVQRRLIAIAGCLSLSVCSLVLAFGQEPARPVTSVLTVKKLCCAKESKPATAALMQVPGVERVVPDHKTRTLTIVSHPKSSPRAMWESVERLNLQPYRLATTEGVWNQKPTR